MVKASIIIVNYNGIKFLKDCFNALKRQTFKDFEIILVDNASSDGSVEFIKKNYPKTKIVQNSRNLGFAGGNNEGYRVAKGKYVALLNNDTIADKNWLKNLVEKAESNEQIALVGSISLPFGANLAKADTSNYKPSTLGVTGADISLRPNQEGMYIDAASVLIRKSLFNKPFDESYFAYAEDVYLSWLSNLKGYKTVYSKSKYLHYGSGTSGKKSSFAVYYVERNMLANFIQFYGSSTIIKLLPLILLSRAVKLASKLLSLDFERAKATANAYFWFIFNLPSLIKKRKRIQEQRIVSDRAILKKMSCKLFGEKEGFSLLSRMLNSFSCAYIKFLGIKTIENEGR